MEAAAAAELQKKQELPSPKPEELPSTVVAPPKLIKHRKRRQRPKITENSIGEIQIDVKRPNSVLVDTSIRALLTNYAFSQLSPESQKILIESLPLVDRPTITDDQRPLELSPSSINNEFFNRACIEWRDRLAYGEFTNEHQTKLKAEQEREKSKIDPWKARNFEGIWGIKSSGGVRENLGVILEKSAMEVKGRMEQGDFEIPESFISEEMWKSEEDDEGDAEQLKDELDDEQQELEEEIEMEVRENGEEEEEEEEEEEVAVNDTAEMAPSPLQQQNPSISTSVPTPPETVTSTQPDVLYSPARKSPSPSSPHLKHPQLPTHQQPVIAEATSSADAQQPSTSNFIAEDDDEVASHVELSSDGMPTHHQWYHQQEHDYLKNDEPESSGMEMDSVNEIVDDTAGIELIENDNASFNTTGYDAELPQEIFHKSPSPMVISNFVSKREEPRHSMMVVEPRSVAAQYRDAFMMEEEPSGNSGGYREEIHVPKNLKVLTFPAGVNYINNDKFIIEESQSQHIPQQQQQSSSSATTTFRTNGATIQPALQNSYFVGSNFAYISKMGNKLESGEPTTTTTRIVKQQEANNNQGQVKPRIIYEISTAEPKMTYEQPATHHVTYAAPPQQEIYHKMVNHNGTTTIYTETTGPPQKKTIIQRKKPTDPYTVQVALQSVANNNTIILTPIGNATTQQVSPQQPQKSIVHIHRTTPMQQPVQFLPQTTFLKKQTVLIPTPAVKAAAPPPQKYATVIRAPAQQVIQTQQLTPIVSSQKIHQKPIQKQKVIMSTSSLQQYRSYNQKPNSHGSRKQLHPQHIVRPAPQTTTTTTVIHQSMVEGVKAGAGSGNAGGQPIPVMISGVSPGNSETYTTHQIPTQQLVSPTQTVVINSAPTSNIFLHQKRPQQTTTTIYQTAPVQQQPQPQQQHIFHQQSSLIQQSSTQLLQQQQQNQSQMMLAPRMRLQTLHRPPPGAVNLERSYQICQAVIQNSPNRHQLNCQLKPPPTTLLGAQKKF